MPDNSISVPMPDVIRFVRQLSHDLRNHLNVLELQSAYLGELAPDAELKAEVKRLRGMLAEMGGSLHRLTDALATPRLTAMEYEGASFMEDLQQKIKAQFPEKSGAIDWQISAGDAALKIDPQLLQEALVEIFANAFQHRRGEGKLCAGAARQDGEFVFILQEPKAAFEGSTENWGREPFQNLGHGHYALGLHRARSIIEAHGGRYGARYDSASSLLVTTIALPLAAAA